MLSFTQAVTRTFSRPVAITHAGDSSGRLFIVTQSGYVWITQGSNSLTDPFLDISNRVNSAGFEQGLLGLAFPPGFPAKNYFYVDYTRKDNAVVISRFFLSATNANVANTNSEQILLVIPKPAIIHNGGQLAFGPDGYLYVGVGDGGPEGDPLNTGQNTANLLGKILRIDVESGASPYGIPPGNPFVGQTNYAPEIWALGLRNPWRFSFDRLTGDLYIGDVGQAQYEEIDFQPTASPGGQNYGWRIIEGPVTYNVPPGFTNFGALTAPVAWYNHNILPTDGSGAVAGGYVYRGPSSPRMDGIYFYGDEVAGWIWGLKNMGGVWQSNVLLTTTIPSSTNFAISSFGEDEQGRLYLADYNRGRIYQVKDSLQTWAPTFTPANGIINSNMVMVSCLTTGAVIHYTTNGVNPTEADAVIVSGTTIQVAIGITNKVKAFRPDLTPSDVTTAIFTPQVPTPTFIPASGGYISNNTQLAISTIMAGATIYFTTNGSLPTTNSSRYVGPIGISAPITIRALAVASGYSNSVVGFAFYNPGRCEIPTFNPPSGPITNGTVISLFCATATAQIHYTLDNSTPTASSPVYSGPFAINGGTLVQVIGIAQGFINSDVSAVYYSLPQTATPSFSPASGPLTYGQQVSISCATVGAEIYYTLDSSLPDTNSTLYTGPLTITNDVILSAVATIVDHVDSVIPSVPFNLVQAAMPVFDPAQGPLTNGATISITCATSNAIIHYTLDGTDPGTNAPVYWNPIVFSDAITLRARAFAPYLGPSDVNSVIFPLWDIKNTVVTTLAGTTLADFSNGFGSMARFSSPQGICIDKGGNLYVADTGNNMLRKISSSGLVTTIAGTGVGGSQLGQATNSQFADMTSVCIDNDGNFYTAEGENCNRVCKISTNGMVTLLASVRECYYGQSLWQITVDGADNVYVGSWATLQKITPAGAVMQLAGELGGTWGYRVGPALDSATNIYCATANYVWRTTPQGTTDFVAGGNPVTDGPCALAGFQWLQGAAIDFATNIFLSDYTWIREIHAGRVSTVAGTGISGYRDGRGSVAQFNATGGLCVDTNGNIYVADSGNNCIRKISPDTAGIGIADDWQVAHFGHIGIDPNDDPDHDGMSNYAEFWAGTDPQDSNSALKIAGNSAIDGSVHLSWNSVSSKSYLVQSSGNLSSWNTIGGPISGNGSVVSFADPSPVQPGQKRFYRIALANL